MLQMAHALATLVNGGTRIEPRLALRLQDPLTQAQETPARAAPVSLGFQAKNVEQVKNAMVGVTQKHGPGRICRRRLSPVAEKLERRKQSPLVRTSGTTQERLPNTSATIHSTSPLHQRKTHYRRGRDRGKRGFWCRGCCADYASGARLLAAGAISEPGRYCRHASWQKRRAHRPTAAGGPGAMATQRGGRHGISQRESGVFAAHQRRWRSVRWKPAAAAAAEVASSASYVPAPAIREMMALFVRHKQQTPASALQPAVSGSSVACRHLLRRQPLVHRERPYLADRTGR